MKSSGGFGSRFAESGGRASGFGSASFRLNCSFRGTEAATAGSQKPPTTVLGGSGDKLEREAESVCVQSIGSAGIKPERHPESEDSQKSSGAKSGFGTHFGESAIRASGFGGRSFRLSSSSHGTEAESADTRKPVDVSPSDFSNKVGLQVESTDPGKPSGFGSSGFGKQFGRQTESANPEKLSNSGSSGFGNKFGRETESADAEKPPEFGSSGFSKFGRQTESADSEKPPGFGSSRFGNKFGHQAESTDLGKPSRFGSSSFSNKFGHEAENADSEKSSGFGTGGFGNKFGRQAEDTGSSRSSGFGSGAFSKGFGRQAEDAGSERPSGFGKGFGGKGFGAKDKDSNDEWSGNGGFSGNSGFQKRGFSGEDSGTSFGSRSLGFSDGKSGPGFGRNFGNGFGGGESDRRSGGCFNCGQEGHMSRDCPEPPKPRGFTCNKCGKEGHKARDCTESQIGGQDTGFGKGNFRKFGEGFGGGGSDRRPSGCFNCGQEGHMSRDCPEPPKPRGFACNKCGKEGHKARDCAESQDGEQDTGFGKGNFRKFGGGFGDSDSNRRSGGCFNCGQEGHMSRDCPEPPKPRESFKCNACGEEGHRARDCPRSGEGGAGRMPSYYIPTEPDEETVFAETAYAVGDHFDNFFDAEVRGSRASREVKLDMYKSFGDAKLQPVILQNVVKAGYTKMTPIQQYGMPLMAEGRDIMGCAPTGSGKTAAFLLPIMSLLIETNDCATETSLPAMPRCIIVSPTRELARQIYLEAVKFGASSPCKAGIVYGGTSCNYQQEQLQLRSCSILVATIGRLNHFVEQCFISLKKLRVVVIDEADRMLDYNFEGSLTQLVNNDDINKESLQTLMFSATFPVEVQLLAEKLLKKDFTKVTVDVVGAANKCIVQNFIEVSADKKKNTLLELLDIDVKSYKVEGQDVFRQKTLVFVNTRKLADVLVAIICQSGLNAMSIHGLRHQAQREEALQLFRSGKTPVLIATAVAERGLDICNVDHVINYDLPKDRGEYVHRIGRTGRVGNTGRATSFYDPRDDQAMASALVSVLREVEQKPPEFLTRDAALAPAVNFPSFGGPNIVNGIQTLQLGSGSKEEDEDW